MSRRSIRRTRRRIMMITRSKETEERRVEEKEEGAIAAAGPSPWRAPGQSVGVPGLPPPRADGDQCR